MNLTTLLKFGENITSETAMGEKAVFGLQVVGIGMGVVFGVLLLLMAILQLFKIFAIKKTVDEIKAEPASTTPVAPASAHAVTVASAPASDEEKIVAIATAAIAAARGESECAFNVISIKKIVK